MRLVLIVETDLGKGATVDATSVANAIGGILDEPVVTLLIGLGIGYFFEVRREDKKRTEDRRLRRIEAQQNSITELQLALTESLHGTQNASVSYLTTIANILESQISPTGGKLSELIPDVLEARWHQDWLASIRKVAVHTVRISDPDLKDLATRCVALMDDLDPSNESEFKEKFPRLAAAVQQANARAGQVYQELITDEQHPKNLRWWRRITGGG